MDTGQVEQLISQVDSGAQMDAELLDYFIKSVADRNIEISLVERWLRAVHSNGISEEDTTHLTKGMMESGAVIKWKNNEKSLVVDKHSTGGVGDKMSLILAPVLAACGLKVPMLAGRGLGHTGGTIDKLESIPGFNCSLTPNQMQSQVDDIGCCIAAQNDSIAPADGLLYAIRDITGTIDSVPLITASIISKKAAEGLGSLVLDVKCGKAAFMKNIQDAIILAKSMVAAAKGLGINTIAQITQMDYPIGRYVGNSLEVIGSIDVLKGVGSLDTLDIVKLQCASLLVQSGRARDVKHSHEIFHEVMNDGTALRKFKEMCIAQEVSEDIAEKLIDNPREVFRKSKHITSIVAHSSGYIIDIDAMILAETSRKHGAGRFSMEDTIIPEIGFEITVTRGQKIDQGQEWLLFHHNEFLDKEQLESLTNALTISTNPVPINCRLLMTIN